MQPHAQQRDYEAILRPSRWADGIQVIGALPDYVIRQLGVGTCARSVWLHEQTVTQICDNRCARPSDSELVLDHMPAAVLRPMFCGIHEHAGAPRIELVEFIRPAHRYLFLGIKLVIRGLGDDELWVSTGYPVSEQTLRRLLRGGRLQPVVGDRKLEGGKTRTARRISSGFATQMP
ncbi:MAG TPA: hypothetical protein VMM18_00875 [Gemmatimonadaceae bacterium]|nr:hypothetical protein [Gemmatimonadaceae bacterium]